MGRVTFDESNKKQSISDYPKLKLKTGEMARIVCLENPVAEYVHTLRAPKILNGRPQMVTVKRGQSEVEDYDMDFIGRPLCLGDEGILEEQGSDKKNCPVCKMASEGDMAQNPVRRFAMHVFKYATRPGSTQITNPFSGALVVWAFTEKIFGKLTDFSTEHGSLQKHDLLLGPCTVEVFQQFDIGVSGKAEWLTSPENQQYVATMFRENKAPDLATFCGRKTERRYLEDDLQKIRDRWRQVNGAPEEAYSTAGSEPNLAEGLDDLLTTQTGSNVSQTEPVQGPSSADVEDLLGTPGIGASRPAPAAEPKATVPPVQELMQPAAKHQVVDPLADPAPVPAQAEAPAETMGAKPGSSGEEMSFEDLLGTSS